MRLRFGDCVLDTDTRELHRAGTRVDLAPKAYELLDLLLRERPKAVSKAEIRDRLWPKTFVSDVTLTTLAFDVRKAIGDDARRPRHLRTVRKYGYAFAGEPAEADGAVLAEPVCRLLTADREFPLAEGEHVIGRGSEADIVLDRPRVSRSHARVRVVSGGAVIEDVGSKNGTFLGGRRIDRAEPIKDGDEIRIGAVRLIFRASSRAAATKTESQ
jgi:DNA-binding winged helix-turn-helix (wHTH) protein